MKLHFENISIEQTLNKKLTVMKCMCVMPTSYASSSAGRMSVWNCVFSSRKEEWTQFSSCNRNISRKFVSLFVSLHPSPPYFRALQLPPEAWLRMSMYNGSVTWFTIRPSGRVSLRYHGDAGHMPPDLLTTN